MRQGLFSTTLEDQNGLRPFHILLKRRWQLLLCIILTCSMTMAWLLSKKPYYQAMTRVEIVMHQPHVFDGPTPFINDLYFGDQCILLLSPQVMDLATEKLQNANTNINGRPEITRNIRSNVKIKPMLHLYWIDILGIAENGQMAADIADHVAAAFLEVSAQAQDEKNQTIISKLKNQIAEYQNEIEMARENLVTFQKDHLATDNGETLTAILLQLDKLEKDLTQQYLAQTELKAGNRTAYTHRTGNDRLYDYDHNAMAGVDRTEMNALKQELRRLKLEEKRLSRIYLPGHPGMKTVRHKIEYQEMKLINYQEKNRRAYSEDVIEASAENIRKINLLKDMLQRKQKTGAELSNHLQVYSGIVSYLEILQHLKSKTERRLHNFLLDMRISGPPVTIMEEAQIPTQPVRVKQSFKIALLLIFGLMFSVSFILAIERLKASADCTWPTK